ncbi:MAG: hypothetical protein ACI910_002265 [Oleispira sp.]|jgi:hypothetical protein
MRRLYFLFFSVTLCLKGYADINLTSLNSRAIQEWDVKIFSGETIYRIGEYKGRLGLKALSNNTASGLVLKKQIDLTKTPYLSWSWLVEKQLLELDERSKGGDDFSARIYVVIDGGLLFWRTQSLNYVWSSNQEKGLVWDNPFAGSNVKMMSIQGKAAKKGHWYEEKRNVYQDLIDTLGDKGSEEANREAYQYIDIVAIMTDTDNSGKDAESYYGDIVFSAI